MSGVQVVQWGLQHEKLGPNTFTLATGLQIVLTGLWLDMCGFLGASPDGLVEDNVIIVKCPFKYRSASLSATLREDHNYIIYKDENDEIQINKNRVYYHQIQGKLYITRRELYYLVVWTPDEVEIVEISQRIHTQSGNSRL